MLGNNFPLGIPKDIFNFPSKRQLCSGPNIMAIATHL